MIFDEAHEIEDVAGQYFGVSRFELSVRGTDARCRRLGASQGFRIGGTGPHPDHARAIAPRISSGLFGAAEGRTGFRSHEAFLMKHEELYRDVLAALELVALQLELLKAAPEEAHSAGASRARNRAASAVLDGRRRPRVRLLDRAPRPRNVSASHADRRFAAARRKAVRRDRHGGADFGDAGGGGRVRVHESSAWACATRARWWSPSHFDYAKQALLYVPQNLPDPRSPAFTAAAAREIIEILMPAAAARSCCSPAISRCG